MQNFVKKLCIACKQTYNAQDFTFCPNCGGDVQQTMHIKDKFHDFMKYQKKHQQTKNNVLQ